MNNGGDRIPEMFGGEAVTARISITNSKGNRIPRNFNRIKGLVLIKTSGDNPGDLVHVFKNDFGYLGLNKRTENYAYYPATMLRDVECFKIEEVI